MNLQPVQAAVICIAMSSAPAPAWADYPAGSPALGGGLDQDRTLYETYPGSNARDWSKPAIVIEEGNLYRTLPGSNARNWGESAIRKENGVIYRTLPGSNSRDWSQPGIKVEED